MDHSDVVPVPLDVIRSTEARSVWKRALKPILTEMRFKPGQSHPTGGRTGWTRDAPPFHEFFWIQINNYGFDRYHGGEFVVEFEFSRADMHTAIRDRMWRLLDVDSQREVIRLNNLTIAALPGPSPEMLAALPGGLSETYLGNFDAMAEEVKPDSDVWFRYARRADVEAWGEFVASRLKNVIKSIEQRLNEMPEGAGVLFGAMRKAGEEKWTSFDS
jgi:hypothetical protein